MRYPRRGHDASSTATVTLIMLLVGTTVLTAAMPLRGDEAVSMPLTQLLGVHTDLAPALAPIKRGPVTVRIESPSHRLAVHHNALTLRALSGDEAAAYPGYGGGLVAVDFEIEFEGEGQLIAHLEAGVTSRLEDEVAVPRQTLALAGTIRIAPADGGFLITLVDMPETVQIAIESKLLRQLVDLCEGFSAFLPVACDELAQDASRATVPLPPAGESVRLPDAYLTAEEQAVFARFAVGG